MIPFGGPGGFLNEFDDCSLGTCAPPMQCVTDTDQFFVDDAGQHVGCEYACNSSVDCPDPGTICVGQNCVIDSCDKTYLGPVDAGAFAPFAACNALATGDGTCLPMSGTQNADHVVPVYECVRPGVSDGGCIWPQQASTPELTCPANQICAVAGAPIYDEDGGGNLPPGSGYGSCETPCDKGGQMLATCGTGETCVALIQAADWSFGFTNTGVCLTVGKGCTPGLPQNEYQACARSSDCVCPLICINDPSYASKVCEGQCTVDSDCPSAGDTCIGGFCFNRPCAVAPDGGAVAGTYNATCTVDAGNDGTCVPTSYPQALAFTSFGICYQGGTATGVCDPTASYDGGSLCAPGTFCVYGDCQQLCDPQTDAGACDAGVACVEWDANPHAGICIESCLPSGSGCVNNGDCCSLDCAAGVCG